MLPRQFGVQRLSPEERIRLVELLWDSLCEAPGEVPLTKIQEQELDRRLAAYREDGEPGEPWREALGRIGKPAE
jgi:putative addiction module component (TIGR02574 family)